MLKAQASTIRHPIKIGRGKSKSNNQIDEPMTYRKECLPRFLRNFMALIVLANAPSTLVMLS